MTNNYQFPPISNTSALTPLSPVKRKKKVDNIQKPSYDNSPKITDFSSDALDAFFNQDNLLKRSLTTYSKPHYFTHVKQTESPSYPYLIKERLEKKPTPITSPRLLFGAKLQLPQKGTLRQTPDGLVYLQISDDYIHKLHPLLPDEGAQKPSYCAHIPIISEKEISSLTLEQIKELEDSFTFSVKDCHCITSTEHPDIESVWVLNVESPSLEELRERYGLPSKLHSQEFAIVIGIKPKEAPSQEMETYYFKINPATSYA